MYELNYRRRGYGVGMEGPFEKERSQKMRKDT